jgi:hypothetical protein
MNWNSHVNTESPHADMILAMRNKVQETNITWKYQHIKGYQDDHRPYGSFDRMSQLNVLVAVTGTNYYYKVWGHSNAREVASTVRVKMEKKATNVHYALGEKLLRHNRA